MRIMGARSLTGRVTGFILLLGITWAIIPCQNMEVNGGPTNLDSAILCAILPERW